MAVGYSGNPNRLRNVFISGIVLGVIGAWVISAVLPNRSASADELAQISERLTAIEEKLATPTPAPLASAGPTGAVTLSQINESPTAFVDKAVEVTGRVSSRHEGVGFILVDDDGTFLWVHTDQPIPNSKATVRGTVTELKDQLATWKEQPGWPANDATLTARLRDERVFIEAESVE